MRAFNKECDLTYTEFRDKFGYKDIELPLNTWVSQSDMTDEEKEQHPFYETTEGYLKTLSYEEAWQEGWKKATDEQRDWYQSLPNFDADIFFKITGIDVRESDKVITLSNGAKVSEQTIKESLKYIAEHNN